MSKPRLLDLFCGAGGCSKGYVDAGFEVVGVDINLQPHYPYEFIQADALTFPLSGFDVIHASPVCKAFSLASYFHHSHDKHENQIPAIRERLKASGKLYIIENVDRAPLIRSIMLCGLMFELRTYRHRYFESNILLFQPEHSKHILKSANPGAIAKENEFWCIGGNFGHKYEAAAAMGIDWISDHKAIAQAIPPAYTYYIGQQLMNVLGVREAV